MEIVDTRVDFEESTLETPDASLFLPTPSPDVFPSLTESKEESSSYLQNSPGNPVQYSGLRLERYAIHQARICSDDDSSLLETLIESAYDDFKSVRVVSEGAGSVHAFVRALSEEFLNCGSSVHLENVTILSPSESRFICRIKALYPAVPRFRHLAQIYQGEAVSDKSMLEASLNAACNAIGQILLTFQPEGFTLPTPPLPGIQEEVKVKESPPQSTVDSIRGSSLFDPVFIPELPRRRSRMLTMFTCGGGSSGKRRM